MIARSMRKGLLVVAAAAFGAAASPALAETLSFKSDIQPIAGTNSKASGTLTAEYDSSSKKLTWHGSYKGIGTYAISAVLHGPDPGRPGAVVRLRNIDSPFEGTAIISDQQAGDLVAGKWFILIRTAASPNGELRGQLVRN
jgi:CHRD domain